jgi:hypothetical protein
LEPDGFFCIWSGPASFEICPVRSKSGRIIFDVNPAKNSAKNRKKSGFVRPDELFVRPDELFVRSCPVRPDRSRTGSNSGVGVNEGVGVGGFWI